MLNYDLQIVHRQTDKSVYVFQLHKELNMNISLFKKDPDDINNTPPSTPDNSCLDGYRPFAGACYKFSSLMQLWQGADNSCQEDGGPLVSIHSEAENAFVSRMMLEHDDTSLWIGLNDLEVYFFCNRL